MSLVALCFRNSDTTLRTLLATQDHQGLISDTQMKTVVLSGTFGYDCVFQIRDTSKVFTDSVSKFSYKLYKIFNKGACFGKCRRSSSQTDPEWCLKGTPDGNLVCGNDPGNNEYQLAQFYFKNGFMKCAGNDSLSIPIDVYSVKNEPNFLTDTKVNITDYDYIATSRLFSTSQADDPQLDKTNINTTFGMNRDMAMSCSLSKPDNVPSGSYTYIEYLNVKFNNPPIWSKRQTGDVRLVRDKSKYGWYYNSAIHYNLSLSNTQRVPSKLVIFLEDGCACAPWIWNKGGPGSNWTALYGGTELDMKKYNFETVSSPQNDNYWFATMNGKKAFVVNLPSITRSKTQFAIEINNDKNSNFYGIQFMFLDADGQIVDRGSDLLNSNPDKFWCYDQLMRLRSSMYNTGIYMGGNNNDQNDGSMLLRSAGWSTGSDFSRYSPEYYFLYDPRTQRLMAVHDGLNETDVILVPRGDFNQTDVTSYGPDRDKWIPAKAPIPEGYFIHAFKDMPQIGDEGRWIIEVRNDTNKEVIFRNKTNINQMLGVRGGRDNGWYTASNVMEICACPPAQNGLFLGPSLTAPI